MYTSRTVRYGRHGSVHAITRNPHSSPEGALAVMQCCFLPVKSAEEEESIALFTSLNQFQLLKDINKTA